VVGGGWWVVGGGGLEVELRRRRAVCRGVGVVRLDTCGLVGWVVSVESWELSVECLVSSRLVSSLVAVLVLCVVLVCA
jgi:hypothetical protein